MVKVANGINRVLYFRLLGEAVEGTKLSLQTEHSKSSSRDSESTATKDGAVASSSTAEEEVSISALIPEPIKGTFDLVKQAHYQNKKLEMWEVDLADKQDDGQGNTTYGSEYRQGTMTEWEETYPAEDNPEVEGTYMTDSVYQTGRVTLTPEQLDELAYAFHDLTADDPAGGGNNGGGQQSP